MVNQKAKLLLQKSLDLLLRRQTNILSAAFIIMATVVFSQILGLIRQRLMVAIFGPSDNLGVYLASIKLPDLLFQIIIGGALSSAFIPVFSEFLTKGKEKEAHEMASTLLTVGFIVFTVLSLVLFIFTPFFLQILNVGSGFSSTQIELMTNLTRIVIVGQLFFIIAMFFTALLQCYNHFLLPGLAASLYNLGIIIGLLTLSQFVGIYSAAYGIVLGAAIFVLAQVPLVMKLGFVFKPRLSLSVPGVSVVSKLMVPRTLSLAIFQIGTIATVALISFFSNAGRNYVIFDYAQTLAFAPVALFGQTIAQAAFPVLARERDRLEDFKDTLLTSFTQVLYLVLPISILFLILRIPIVRLVFGAQQFDWNATVLTGKTVAFLSLSIFAQALVYLVSRAFYALHDTKIPLIVGALTTTLMIGLGYLFVLQYKALGYVFFLGYTFVGVESIAIAYSIGNIANFLILFYLLGRKVGGFNMAKIVGPTVKIFVASFFTGIALYVPIKLLDKLVFDTTKTINLLILTGISSLVGLILYLFLTWLFNVKEAQTFILIFKRVGNWREVLQKSDEVIDPLSQNP